MHRLVDRIAIKKLDHVGLFSYPQPEIANVCAIIVEVGLLRNRSLCEIAAYNL